VQRRTCYDAAPRYGAPHNDCPRCSEEDAQCVLPIISSIAWILLIGGPPDGHYLNLPVVEEDGRLVAIVDVLKLTYATLEQVTVLVYSTGYFRIHTLFN
jgi:hypothetical protein